MAKFSTLLSLLIFCSTEAKGAAANKKDTPVSKECLSQNRQVPPPGRNLNGYSVQF